MLADNELLRRYCADRVESAFAEIVRRHADLVYAAALRQLNGDADLARDVAQIVFIDLARKAVSMIEHRSVAGWLYTSARFAAAKLARSEQRRRCREGQASSMDGQSVGVPEDLGHVIEEAMQELDEDEREAVLLRFFEGRDFKSVGVCLGISDEAARKRVNRAIERLRDLLGQRGICSSESALTAALSGVLTLGFSTDLHASILRSVLAASVQTTPSITSTLIQITKMKTTLLLTGLAVGLGTATLLQRGTGARLRAENEALAAEVAALTAQSLERQVPGVDNSIRDELARLRKDHSELLRLRDEITRLRAGQRQQTSPTRPDTAKDEELLATQQVCIETKFLKGPTAALKKLSLDTLGIDITGVGMTAILTDPQLKALVEGFESSPGIDLLSMPRITTMHNRAASVGVAPAVGAAGLEVKLGPTADLLPVVYADRRTVSLEATAGLAEELAIPDAAEQKQLRQTSVSGTGVIADGETMVLCQRIGGASGNTVPSHSPMSLVVFATPSLVDPAGNRIHP